MEGNLAIVLSRSERELLLNLYHLDPAVEKKLLSAKPEAHRYRVEFTPAEFAGVIAGLASESNHTEDRIMAKAYDDLQGKLEALEKKDA